MALFPLGILSAAGAGGPVGAYELITSSILTGSQSSVTFSSLGTYSSTYKHLQIRMVTLGTVDNWFRVQINAATTGYYSHRLWGESNLVRSAAHDTSTTGMQLIGLTGSSSIPGRSVIDILDPYSTTKNTTIRTFSGGPNTVVLTSGLWNNTASVTSITLNHDGGNWATGSRFSIYGIRG
jgi:hypothetical protein